MTSAFDPLMLRPTDIIITNDNKTEIPVTASERQKQVLEIEHLPSLYIHSYRNGNLNRSYRALTDGTRNYRSYRILHLRSKGFTHGRCVTCGQQMQNNYYNVCLQRRY